MFGMDALLTPDRIPAIAKMLGITAARIDHDPAAGKLYVSWMRKGVVECVEVPCGRPFTAEQIAELLTQHDVTRAMAAKIPAGYVRCAWICNHCGQTIEGFYPPEDPGERGRVCRDVKAAMDRHHETCQGKSPP
jgi:hypothetical protein